MLKVKDLLAQLPEYEQILLANTIAAGLQRARPASARPTRTATRRMWCSSWRT